VTDPVGFRQGQRVRTRTDSKLMPVDGTIETVILPKDGKRFVVMHGDDGNYYHRWFTEIEAIEASRNEGERADHDLLPHRGA
jgi:hypothetical protein